MGNKYWESVTNFRGLGNIQGLAESMKNQSVITITGIVEQSYHNDDLKLLESQRFGETSDIDFGVIFLQDPSTSTDGESKAIHFRLDNGNTVFHIPKQNTSQKTEVDFFSTANFWYKTPNPAGGKDWTQKPFSEFSTVVFKDEIDKTLTPGGHNTGRQVLIVT